MRTAVGLMAEKGYEGTSTRDIASAAGVSVAALYYHFPSKLDLLREFLHEAHEVVLARLAKELDAAGHDPLARLDVAVATRIWPNLHDEWAQQAAQVSWREHGRTEAADRAVIAKTIERMVDHIAGVVSDGVEAGVSRNTEPRDVARDVRTRCTVRVDTFPPVNRSLETATATHSHPHTPHTPTPP